MPKPAREVWVVDDDPALRWVMQTALREAGHQSRSFNDAQEARLALKQATPDCFITDIQLPGDDGFKLLAELRRAHPQLPVVVVTAHSDLQSAVAAYQGGAFEYLPKPFDVDELLSVLGRAMSVTAADEVASPSKREDSDSLIGEALEMQAVFRSIGRLAGTNLNVLITGETGTGKELAARALHRHSTRKSAPLIALNTAAIPAELLESELFGHERGAFTGASSRRVGRFEQAHGGTLFLDEIGDMPPALQTRLLRVLAEGEFYRIGGHQTVKVDVRVFAATHQNLERLVEQGQFREDLFHRLNVVQIRMPALRERRSDIPVLLEHFMRSSAHELGLEAKRLTADAMAELQARAWPGNVRELANACRRLTLMAAGRIVHRGDLMGLLDPPAVSGEQQDDWRDALRAWARQQLVDGKQNIYELAFEDMEKVLIEAALEASSGHRQRAARRLGIGRNTLARKFKHK